MTIPRRGFFGYFGAAIAAFFSLFKTIPAGTLPYPSPYDPSTDWPKAEGDLSVAIADLEAIREYAGFRTIKWIPVTERLPECNMGDSGWPDSYSHQVIVAAADGTVKIRRRYEDFAGEPKKAGDAWWGYHYGNSGMTSGGINGSPITHWAELPEPPCSAV